MIGPPPAWLSESEIAELEIVSLPTSGQGDAEQAVYRFPGGEYVAGSKEEEAAIREVFPLAKIRRAS
jgi:hypothetical protein